MEEDTDDVLLFLDSEDVPEIADADPFHIEPMNLAITTFEDEPPTLMQLAFESESLKIVAEHLHVLLQTEGNVKYSQKTRNEIENVLRVFTYQSGLLAIEKASPTVLPFTKAANQQTNNASNKDSLSKLSKQLLKAQEETASYSRQNQIIAQQLQGLQRAVSNLSIENNALLVEKHGLILKLNANRRESDEYEAKSKIEADNLKDMISQLKDKSSQEEFDILRMQRQLNALSDQLAQSNSTVALLKSKLEAKNDKLKDVQRRSYQETALLHETEAENEQLNIQIGELSERIEQFAQQINECSPEVLSATVNEKEKLSNALDEMMKICDEQSQEIILLHNAHAKSTQIIQRQMEILNSYDENMSELVAQKDEAVQNHIAIAREFDTTKQKLEESCENNLSNAYLNAIIDLLKVNNEDVNPENALEYIQGLLKGTIETPAAEMNKRLLTIIENQLRFISNMAINGELNLLLLSSDKADEIYMDISSVRDQVLIEVARCKTFITMNNLKLNSDVTPQVAKSKIDSLNNSQDLSQREEFDLIATQSSNANIMRIFAEHLLGINQEYDKYLQEAAEIINYKEDVQNIPKVIVEKLRSFRALAKKCNDITQQIDFNNFDSSIESIYNIFKQNSIIKTIVDNELRNATHFEGNVIDVPAYSAKCIVDMQQLLEELSSEDAKGLKEQLKIIQAKLTNEKESSSREIARLETEIIEKTKITDDLTEQNNNDANEIKSLKKAIQNLEALNEDVQTKYQMLSDTLKEIEGDVQRFRSENSSLRKDIATKDITFQERLDRVLQVERERHTNEISDLENRMKVQNDKYKEELSSKSAKLKEAKKKLREILTSYDSAFKKQKESMVALRAQNQSLITRVAQSQPINQQTNETAKSTDLKTLETEKTILQMRNKQLTEMIDKIQTARDTYWQSQIALQNTELNSTNQAKIQIIKDSHLEFVSNISKLLHKYVARAYDGSDQATLDLVSTVVERIELIEKKIAIVNKKSELVSSPKTNAQIDASDLPKVIKTIKSLKEWEKWAKEIYDNTTNLDSKKLKEKELRLKLGEMITSSICNRKLLKELDSLRSQKQALLIGAGYVHGSCEITPGALAKVVVFGIRLGKKARQTEPPSFVFRGQNLLRSSKIWKM